MTKHRKPDEPADEPTAKPKQIEPAWSEDNSWGDTSPPKTRGAEPVAAKPADDFTLPERGVVEVLADIDTAIANLTRLSPSGVETAAGQLAALVGELRGMVK